MVKSNRRATIIGLGTLALGSSTLFTSAAIENAAAADAQFGVIVEDDLIVEAGKAFRQSNGTFDPQSADAAGWAYERPNSGVFSGGNDFELEDGNFRDAVPFATINNEQNSTLSIEVATGLSEDGTGGQTHSFLNLLQVRNDGSTEREVGIRFSRLGEDAADGPVPIASIPDVYQFERDGTRISSGSNTLDVGEVSNSDGDVDSDSQTVDTYLTLEPGETKQVDLVVDTTDIYDEILDAAEGTNPFNNEIDTVSLVDEIEIGTDSNDPPDPSPDS